MARAAVSPPALIAGAAGAVAGFVALPPEGIVIGVGAWAAGAWATVVLRRRRVSTRRPIDPYAVREPWRRHVQHALRAHRRFDELTADVAAGPLHDRLILIGTELDEGVNACWAVARRGNLLDDARRSIDTVGVKQQLHATEREPAADPEVRERTRAALLAQLESAERLDATIRSTRDRLRLLDARLTEAVARAAEIGVAGQVADLEGVGVDIAGVAEEMEALRAALDEVNRTTGAVDPTRQARREAAIDPSSTAPALGEGMPEPTHLGEGSTPPRPYPPSVGYPPSAGYPPPTSYPHTAGDRKTRGDEQATSRAEETPADDEQTTPRAEAPADNDQTTSRAEAPADNDQTAHADETPADETPGDETPTDETPGDEAPADDDQPADRQQQRHEPPPESAP